MFDRILAGILPLQLEGDELAFNIRLLDTIMYRKGNFKELANHSIDEAIIQTGTTVRPTRALTSSENLIKYLSVLGLRVTQLNTEEANALYKMGQPLGFMLLDGQDMVYFGLFQFVFQMAETALNPRQRVRRILSRPLAFYLSIKGKTADRRVCELLELVELPTDFINRFPRELSGGQLQRINFARALAAEPKLIICDEITSALDPLVSAAIIELLRNLKKQLGVAYAFISHDLSTVANLADSIVVMRNGKIVDFDATEKVLEPPHHPYTELLLNSIPKLQPWWLEEVKLQRKDSGQ